MYPVFGPFIDRILFFPSPLRFHLVEKNQWRPSIQLHNGALIEQLNIGRNGSTAGAFSILHVKALLERIRLSIRWNSQKKKKLKNLRATLATALIHLFVLSWLHHFLSLSLLCFLSPS